MQGKTQSGFSYDIPYERLNNIELLDMMAEMESNPIFMGKVCELLLGKEQKKLLYEHVRENGFVPIDKIEKEITEMFENMGETGKKS